MARKPNKLKNEINCYLDQRIQDSGACNCQWHHNNQIGEEGKNAEDNVCSGTKTGFDYLKK